MIQNRLKASRSKLLMGGMTCLLLANVPRFIHLNVALSADAIDGLRGMLIGLSIGMNLLFVARNGRNRDCAG